jgi:hypothetical protein
MAKKWLPAEWKQQEIDVTPSIRPRKFVRQNKSIIKSVLSYLGVIKAQTAVIEAEKDRRVAIGALNNVDDDIELARKETRLKIAIVDAKMDALHAGTRQMKKQIGKGSIPDGIAEAHDLGREDFNDD